MPLSGALPNYSGDIAAPICDFWLDSYFKLAYFW
jgi:hypothetical protein